MSRSYDFRSRSLGGIAEGLSTSPPSRILPFDDGDDNITVAAARASAENIEVVHGSAVSVTRPSMPPENSAVPPLHPRRASRAGSSLDLSFLPSAVRFAAARHPSITSLRRHFRYSTTAAGGSGGEDDDDLHHSSLTSGRRTVAQPLVQPPSSRRQQVMAPLSAAGGGRPPVPQRSPLRPPVPPPPQISANPLRLIDATSLGGGDLPPCGTPASSMSSPRLTPRLASVSTPGRVPRLQNNFKYLNRRGDMAGTPLSPSPRTSTRVCTSSTAVDELPALDSGEGPATKLAISGDEDPMPIERMPPRRVLTTPYLNVGGRGRRIGESADAPNRRSVLTGDGGVAADVVVVHGRSQAPGTLPSFEANGSELGAMLRADAKIQHHQSARESPALRDQENHFNPRTVRTAHVYLQFTLKYLLLYGIIAHRTSVSSWPTNHTSSWP